MGNRANIVVKSGEKEIWLYTHSGRDQLPWQLRAALDRGRERWDDPSYLTRIIFCEMIRHSVAGTTGYGISADPCDGSIITVDCNTQTVEIEGKQPLSFESFISNIDGW